MYLYSYFFSSPFQKQIDSSHFGAHFNDSISRFDYAYLRPIASYLHIVILSGISIRFWRGASGWVVHDFIFSRRSPSIRRSWCWRLRRIWLSRRSYRTSGVRTKQLSPDSSVYFDVERPLRKQVRPKTVSQIFVGFFFFRRFGFPINIHTCKCTQTLIHICKYAQIRIMYTILAGRKRP